MVVSTEEIHYCPACNEPTEFTYKRTDFNRNKDTDEYCGSCNPELVEECEDFLEALETP